MGGARGGDKCLNNLPDLIDTTAKVVNRNVLMFVMHFDTMRFWDGSKVDYRIQEVKEADEQEMRGTLNSICILFEIKLPVWHYCASLDTLKVQLLNESLKTYLFLIDFIGLLLKPRPLFPRFDLYHLCQGTTLVLN